MLPWSTVWASSPCHPSDPNPAHNNEAWSVNPNGTITEEMSGLCLDAPTTAVFGSVFINTCSGAATQQWAWDNTSHHISSGAGPGLCLDVAQLPRTDPCALPPASSMAMCDTTLTFQERVTDLVGNLTLAEKVGLIVTDSSAVPRLNIPAYQWWNEALHGG